MSVNELIERTTINFPRDISLDEARELLTYLAKNLPARMQYGKSQDFIIDSDEEGSVREIPGTISLGGLMTSTDPDSLANEGFRFTHSDRDVTRAGEFRFSPIPGYDLEEHTPHSIKFWDDTREKIEEYFRTHPEEPS